MAGSTDVKKHKSRFWTSLPCFKYKTTKVTWGIKVVERTLTLKAFRKTAILNYK